MRSTIVWVVLAGLLGCARFYPRYPAGPCRGCRDPYLQLAEALGTCGPAPYAITIDGISHEINRLCAYNAYRGAATSLETAGDFGGAARAWWAAIYSVNGANESRHDRETQLAEALEGLHRVAAARQQPSWAALLELSAAMPDTWAKSPEGQDEQRRYVAAQRAVEKAREEAEKAAAKAREATQWQAAGALMRTELHQSSFEESMQSYIDLRRQNRETDEALAELETAASDKEQEIYAAVEAQFNDLQLEPKIVGQLVGFYLQSAKDDGPFLDAIKRISDEREWPQVSAAAAHVSRPNPTIDQLKPLAAEIAKVESAAVKKERVHARYVPPSDQEIRDALDPALQAKKAEAQRRATAEEAEKASRASTAKAHADLVAQSRKGKACTSNEDCEDYASCFEGDSAACVRRAQRLNPEKDASTYWMFMGLACTHGAVDTCEPAAQTQLSDVVPFADPRTAKNYLDIACKSGRRTACESAAPLQARFDADRAAVQGRCAEDGECADLADCEKHGQRCQAYLGRLIYVKKVPAEATAFAQSGCAQGNGALCGELGVMAAAGRPGPKNPQRALASYERGCDLKDAPSCVYAGEAYWGGPGMEAYPKDRAKAAKLLDRACSLHKFWCQMGRQWRAKHP